MIRDQFIVICAGRDTNYADVNDIYVYSIQDQEISKSGVKTPWTGKCVCFAMNNEQRNELAVFGYVRQQWKISEIDEHLFPPHYIIKIIDRFYLQQYIHLIKPNNGKHSRIDVFDIINTQC